MDNSRFFHLRFIGILAILMVFSTLCMAGEPRNAMVTVIRSDNQKPLADAVVMVTGLNAHPETEKPQMGYTDAEGNYSYYFTDPVVIHVSHLGFTTITDTLYAPENKTYFITYVSQNIPDVVVTGQYGSSRPEKSVYEVKVINGDMIRAKGANNLREALQNELHIDLQQDQVFGSSLGINGISGEGVKILVDGVPIVGRMDGKLDLSQINIANIDRIEIVEGPLSVMYGTDAMGGVINIITKSIQKEKVNVNLKGYYESVGQYNVQADAGFVMKKSQLFLSAGRNYFNGFTTLNIPRFKEWKPKEQYFADAKYVYTGNRFRVSVSGSFFRELVVNRSAPAKTLASGDTASWTYSGIDAHYLTYRPRISGSFMYRFKEGYQLDALLAYSGFVRYSTAYYKDLVTGHEQVANDPTSPNDTTRYNAFVMRATYTMPAWKNRLNFQFGVDLNQEYVSLTNIKDNKQQSGDYAAFGGIRITIVEGLDIQPAVRFSYNTRFTVPLIPSVNLRYNYKKNLVVRASYGRGYRAPSLKELFLAFYDSNHNLAGNPDLTPEDGHNISASVNYTVPIKNNHKITFATSGFYNHIRNRIELVLVGNFIPNQYQYFNLRHYNTYGAQEAVTYEWKRLRIGTSVLYTGYETTDTSAKSSSVKFNSIDVSAIVGYKIPIAEIGVNVMYKYTGTRPLFFIDNGLQTGTRNPFHILDISLTRNFWKDRIQLTVGGKNLLGVTDVKGNNVSGTAIAHNSSPNNLNIGWGRTFFTSLVFHFSK